MRFSLPFPRASMMSAVVLALLAAACAGEDPAALSVGRVSYPSHAVSALTPAQLEELADLTALGLATADDELDDLLQPVVARDLDRSRLATLPLHLGARRMGLGERSLREAYAASPEWELTVRHMVRLAPRHASAAQRREARAVAEQVARRVAQGEPLGELARELSEEPGAAATGGLLRPGREGSWVGEFWQAAAALQVGEASGVVETEYGYHVLRLEDRRPVPFEEASRIRLLRQRVPSHVARAAMEEWAATRAPVQLGEDAAAAARERLLAGCAPGENELATGTDAGYTAADLAAAWVALPPERRQALRSAPAGAFLEWSREDARERIWARHAAREGAEALPAEAGTGGTLRRAAAVIGFAPGQETTVIARTALTALAARGQEERIARAELAGWRPLLRKRYPADGLASCTSEGSSSSEIRNSEKTR